LSNVIIANVPHLEAHTRSVDFVTDGPEHTQQFGVRLGALIRPGDVICLSGELGAGKTTLAAGIGHGWGAREVVNSPTFVFVNEYSRADDGRLYHVDAYRLRDAADAESIALTDILSDTNSAIMIEWPERVMACVPPERLWIDLQWEGERTRRVRVEGRGARYVELAEKLRIEG
jgi:tRNA threonylcarbamoyladenosine biosynthesis protein TsaE